MNRANEGSLDCQVCLGLLGQLEERAIEDIKVIRDNLVRAEKVPWVPRATLDQLAHPVLENKALQENVDLQAKLVNSHKIEKSKKSLCI